VRPIIEGEQDGISELLPQTIDEIPGIEGVFQELFHHLFGDVRRERRSR
jgi:hypothetical protein